MNQYANYDPEKIKDFLQNCPDGMEELKKMYPYIGAKGLADKYNVPIYVIYEIAKKLNIKRFPIKDRLCKDCWKKPVHKKNNFCIDCYRIRQRDRERRRVLKDPVKTRLYNCFNGIKSRSIVKPDFTREYLVELYNQQNGKCFYTGQDLIAILPGEPIHPNSISVDRIDSTKGYTKDNIVLCGLLINLSKTNMSQKTFYNMCCLVSNHLKGIVLDDHQYESRRSGRFQTLEKFPIRKKVFYRSI